MIINLMAMCLAIACAMLVIFTAIKAREHTSAPIKPGSASPTGTTPSVAIVPYNSSASAVSAVWMFLWIFLANVVRSKFPQAQFGVIIYSIIVLVASCNAPLLPNMTYGRKFGKSLLIAELMGFAIATGVAFFVVPVSCRMIVEKMFAGYLGAIRGCLKAHENFFTRMQDKEAMSRFLIIYSTPPPETAAVKSAVTALTGLHGNLQANLPFAKQEFGFGKFGPLEYKEIGRLLRSVMLPTVGLGSVSEIMRNIAIYRGWTPETVEKYGAEETAERDHAVSEWTSNMSLLHQPFTDYIEVLYESLEHCSLQLGFKPKQKASKASPGPEGGDIESEAQATGPGKPGFAAYLERKIDEFYAGKPETLIQWGKRRGIEFAPDFFDHPEDATFVVSEENLSQVQMRRQQHQRQLYLLLYVSDSMPYSWSIGSEVADCLSFQLEFLLHGIGKSILNLVRYADSLVENGTMSKGRIVFPRMRQFRKLFASLIHGDIAADEASYRDINAGSYQVQLGASFEARKDPEHLPPTNALERFGDRLRGVADFFRSSHAVFGLRTALATVSCAIPM
jgi:hypothetical protein